MKLTILEGDKLMKLNQAMQGLRIKPSVKVYG